MARVKVGKRAKGTRANAGMRAAAAAGGPMAGVRGAKGGKNRITATAGGKNKPRGGGGGGASILRGGAAGGVKQPGRRGGARPATTKRGTAARNREVANMLNPPVKRGKAEFTVG